mgnify:CR=1 FL=1
MTITELDVHEIETLEQFIDTFEIPQKDVADVITELHGDRIMDQYTNDTSVAENNSLTTESVSDVTQLPPNDVISLAEDVPSVGPIDEIILRVLEQEDEEYVHVTLTNIYAIDAEYLDEVFDEMTLNTDVIEEMKDHAETTDGVVRVAKVDTADPTSATTTREQLIVALNRHKRTRPDDDLERLNDLQRDLEDKENVTAVELDSVYSL